MTPARPLPEAPAAADIRLAIDGALRFSAPQIALYESCPRRFFYTHVLQIGGRRTATPFMQMHEAVRSVFQAVIAGTAAVATAEALDRAVADALASHGLDGYGYAGDYKAFASAMIRYFVSIREGHTPQTPVALSLTFGGEQIIVQPDDVLVGSDGRTTLRRIRTGHQRSSEGKDVGAAAFLLAAQKAFPHATVELVYLADEVRQAIPLSDRELKTRSGKIDGFLKDIRAGRFPADPSPRTCPGCPAFFVCGPTPDGTLQKKF